MMYQYDFTDHTKCTTLVVVIDDKRGYACLGAGQMRNLCNCFSTLLCCSANEKTNDKNTDRPIQRFIFWCQEKQKNYSVVTVKLHAKRNECNFKDT